MRILFVVPGPPWGNMGGAAIYAYTLAKGLIELGNEVYVLTQDISEKNYMMKSGLHVYCIKGTPRWPKFIFRAKRKLVELCKVYGFDVIHGIEVFGASATLAKRNLSGIPIVTTTTNQLWDEVKYRFLEGINILKEDFTPTKLLELYYSCFSEIMLGFFELHCYNHSDKVIAASNYMAKRVSQLYGVQSNKVVVVLNGIDVEKYKIENKKAIDSVRDKFGLNSSPLVLYVGRLDERKGILHLILAFYSVLKRIPNARLVIVGTGHLKDSLMKVARSLRMNGSVVFCGRVSDEELIALYKIADVCVIPSTYEPSSLVPLEAMAAGIPVIATNVGGFPDYITHGETGLLVEPANPYALAKAIVKVLLDENFTNNLKKRIREVLPNFDYRIMAKNTLRVYRSLA